MINKINTPYSEEAKWFLEKVQEQQEQLAKELRIQIAVLDDQGEPVTESNQQSTIIRLIRKSPKGKDLSNQAYAQAGDLVTANSDAVLIKIFDGLVSFWAPVATAEGKIIGSVVGGGGPFMAQKIDPENFKEKLSKFYQDADFKNAGVPEEDLFNAVKGTPVFTPDVAQRKITEFGRTVGILAEETEFGQVFSLSLKKDK